MEALLTAPGHQLEALFAEAILMTEPCKQAS